MIYITGDTHGDFSRFSSARFPTGRELKKNDYVIITGDFGGIWNVNQPSDSERHWMGWLGKKPWTTLFLDGNHENFDRLDALPEKEMFGSYVGVTHKVHPIYHLKRGYVYEIDGKKIFVFGGGYSIDILTRTPNISWWSRELPSYEEYNRGLDSLKLHDNKVDYIMTHTCSMRDFELMSKDYDMLHKDDVPAENQLRNYFNIIQGETEYSKWFCGHFHINKIYDKTNFLYGDIIKL